MPNWCIEDIWHLYICNWSKYSAHVRFAESFAVYILCMASLSSIKNISNLTVSDITYEIADFLIGEIDELVLMPDYDECYYRLEIMMTRIQNLS